MDRVSFVYCFGFVFEHSPWLAERAFDRFAVSEPVSAAPVHSPLCRTFRAASDDEQQRVIDMHPGLAGKLAGAGKLKAESAEEKRLVGLTMFESGERVRFTSVNDGYEKKNSALPS